MNEFIAGQVEENEITGLAYGVVKDGKLMEKGAFGYANVEEEVEVTADTIFLLASLSKTVTATAAMILYDRGNLDIEEDINKYLPFKVTNPEYPKVPITAKMLMTHTSSISDESYNEIDDSILYAREGEELEHTLASLLEEYFTEDGEFYDPDTCFLKAKPGTKDEYSNVGSALLGLLVEVIAEQSFDEFCSENIFEPLAMENTSWNLDDLDLEKIALPYEDSETTKGHYECPDYPNGMLRSTIEDMAKFLIMFINNGEYKGTRILKKETAELMKEVHFENKDGGDKSRTGLAWYYQDYGEGEVYLGHTGVEEGVTTSMFYNVESGVGVLIFSNMSEAEISDIEDHIFQNM